MLRKTLVMGCAMVLVVVISGLPAWSGNGRGINAKMAGSGDCISDVAYQELSQAEIDGLIHMRQEEKLARDVYATLSTYWGHWVFSNIASSEQQHMDKVVELLAKYQVTDPVADDTVGVFASPEFQALFNELVEDGKVSLADALYVGATIEDLDIYDLKEELLLTDNVDIQRVYQNLMKGSRNHLRAFVSQLALQGVEYAAQYLTQEEADAIVTSAPERGSANENGDAIEKGNRKGSKLSLGTNGLVDSVLLAGRGGHGNGGKGHGPGDGTGSGTGPKDGTGNGPGDCTNV